MSTGGTSPSTQPNTPSSSNNLERFRPCQRTCLFTQRKEESTNDGAFLEHAQRPCVPRACRFRTSDNAMGVYALVDPTDASMIASDVSIETLVEQLAEISFEDDSYKDKIKTTMEVAPNNIENRLIQMIFEHAENKAAAAAATPTAASVQSNDITTEKCLSKLEEAKSGAFLCAATVTQSWVYLAYVGTIRFFLISNTGNELVISNDRPQFYQTGSIHTIDNDDERLRLQKQNVDLTTVHTEGLDSDHSRFTRCIGKLSEKLLSSTASANDVNEARCSALICEPKFIKFKKLPQDFALVMMTNKLYQMYLSTVLSEDEISTDFAVLIKDKLQRVNPAESIVHEIKERFQVLTDPTNDSALTDQMGLLIHFFYQKSTEPSSKFCIREPNVPRAVVGEVSIEEVRQFIQKSEESQRRREQSLIASRNSGHKREHHANGTPIDPFVRFDVYQKALDDNEELQHADHFIVDLLYKTSTAELEESLDQYLKEHPSLKCD